MGKSFRVVSPSAAVLEFSAGIGLPLEDWAAQETAGAV